MGKLGEEEDEEEKSATERGRKYTDLGSDFERDEHVACHASTLALAMTDEVRVGKKRCKPDHLYHLYKRQQKPCVFCLPLFPPTRLEVGV